MWIAALGSLYVLLSYPIVSLASLAHNHHTNIISLLNNFNFFHLKNNRDLVLSLLEDGPINGIMT